MGRVAVRTIVVARLAGLLCFAAGIGPGQSTTDETFRVDVRLVRVLATVKDTNGHPVSGLTRDDLAISDNGSPQQIAVFERFTEQPLSVAILLDISGSTAKDMKGQTEAV